MPKRQAPLQVIDDPADIPAFNDETEEAAYWGTHRLGDALLTQMQPLGADVAPPARGTTPVTLRMDPDLLARLRTLARQREMPYQRLLKQLLEERLQQVEAGGQKRTHPAAAADSETVKQTAQTIAKLARDLETVVARLA